MAGMPTSVGHVLGGITAGLIAAGAHGPGATSFPPTSRPHSGAGAQDPDATGFRKGQQLSRLALFGLLGAAPDLDLLFGTHSTYTHSIGAVAVVGIIAWLVTPGRRPRLAVAAAAAWASHLVLDWLGADSTPPLGIMALWPLTTEYYQSPVAIFQAISRRYWLPEFYSYNARAVLREVLILGPLAWLAWRAARHTTETTE